ncbi:MAG: hypothetical protein RLZZ543_1637 [Bacteroidota bacterium]|jgi:hypothetical protein
MRLLRLLLLLIFWSFATSLKAQLIPMSGIFNLDQGCFFEDSCSYISIGSNISDSLWQIGTSANKSVFGAAFEGSKSMLTDTSGPYPVNSDASFTYRFANAFNWGGIVLSFRHWYETDSLKDGGNIEVSFDDGASWKDVYDDSSFLYTISDTLLSENLYTSQDTLFDGKRGFTGSSGGWIQTRIQWVFYLPLRLSEINSEWDVLFRFHFRSDSIPETRDGWMIDQIEASFVDVGGGIENMQNSSLQLYPNPAKNNLTISAPFQWQSTIEATIYSLDGRKVMEETIRSDSKQLSLKLKETLQPGAYILHLNDGKHSQQQRFVINE